MSTSCYSLLIDSLIDSVVVDAVVCSPLSEGRLNPSAPGSHAPTCTAGHSLVPCVHLVEREYGRYQRALSRILLGGLIDAGEQFTVIGLGDVPRDGGGALFSSGARAFEPCQGGISRKGSCTSCSLKDCVAPIVYCRYGTPRQGGGGDAFCVRAIPSLEWSRTSPPEGSLREQRKARAGALKAVLLELNVPVHVLFN